MQKSYFGIPLSLCFHLIAINTTLYFLTPETYRGSVVGVIYYNVAWFLVTHSINFYSTARREGFTTKTTNFPQLFMLYGLVFFSSFALLGSKVYTPLYLIGVYSLICLELVLLRIFFFWAKQKYYSKENKQTKVVVVGWDKNLKKVRSIFDNQEFNYKYVGFFDNKTSKSSTYLGSIEECYQYIFEKDISEEFLISVKSDFDLFSVLFICVYAKIKTIKTTKIIITVFISRMCYNVFVYGLLRV